MPVLILPASKSFKIQLKKEFARLEVVDLPEKMDSNISVTWSAHHATHAEEAHSIAKIKYVLDKIKETV